MRSTIMREYTDGCVYVMARDATSAAKKIAKIYAGIRKTRAHEQKSNAAWVRKHGRALYNLCAGR